MLNTNPNQTLTHSFAEYYYWEAMQNLLNRPEVK